MAAVAESPAEKQVEIFNTAQRNIAVDVKVGEDIQTFNWEPYLKGKTSPLRTSVKVPVSTFELLKKHKGFAAMLEDNTFTTRTA